MAGQSDFLSSPVNRQSLATIGAGAVRPLGAPARCQSGESLAGGLKDHFASRLGLIAPDNHVDIERINLDAAAAPPRPLGSDERGSRPKEGIDHDIAASRRNLAAEINEGRTVRTSIDKMANAGGRSALVMSRRAKNFRDKCRSVEARDLIDGAIKKANLSLTAVEFNKLVELACEREETACRDLGRMSAQDSGWGFGRTTATAGVGNRSGPVTDISGSTSAMIMATATAMVTEHPGVR
jgi:hypothetical protein